MMEGLSYRDAWMHLKITAVTTIVMALMTPVMTTTSTTMKNVTVNGGIYDINGDNCPSVP